MPGDKPYEFVVRDPWESMAPCGKGLVGEDGGERGEGVRVVANGL